MTIHQAAARATADSPIARALARQAHGKAANDNSQYDDADREIFEAALRYFALHGLGAADEARQQAEACFVIGDLNGFDRWLSICSKLDRRMAANTSRKFATPDTQTLA